MPDDSSPLPSNSGSSIIPFTSDEFSVELIPNGESFNVAAPGLARALGFREARDMLRSVPESEKGSARMRTPGGEQEIGYLTEPGFYRVIGQRQASRVKDDELRNQVERFQSWFYGNVLPEIRKTGGYGHVAATVESLTPLEYARRLVDAEERVEAEHARADKAEKKLEVEQRHRQAVEGGDGIHLTDFGKKFFSEVPARKFDEHLYKHGWLINQHNTRVRADGTVVDGYDHRKPTAKGRPFIYDHDQGNHGGRRRFQARVRPQKEVELRDALAAEGLPVNTHSTGLVLISNEDIKELTA